MPASKNPQSGFSLIEMLVAILILTVGLLGLAQLQITAMKTNSQSATSAAATALAQQVVEKIAARAADDAMFTPSTNITWGGSPVSVAGAGTYDITYDVTQVEANGTAIPNLFKIDVNVLSTRDLMHVLGNQQRLATASTLKRAI